MEGNRDRRVGQETDGRFFALLRSGLWNEVPEREPFAGNTDWEALYLLASQQTVELAGLRWRRFAISVQLLVIADLLGNFFLLDLFLNLYIFEFFAHTLIYSS